MRLKNRALWLFAPIALVVCLSGPGFADPPARIGRLNYVRERIGFVSAGRCRRLGACDDQYSPENRGSLME
jgi:hypothetical protein